MRMMLHLYAKHRTIQRTLGAFTNFRTKQGRELAPTSQLNYVSALRMGLHVMGIQTSELEFLPTIRFIRKRLETWVRAQAIPMLPSEVRRVLRITKSQTLRARIAMTWCLGLRVSDAKHLRVCDVLNCDRDGILIRLRGAKGAKPGSESYYRAMPARGAIARQAYQFLRRKGRNSQDLLFPATSYNQVAQQIKKVNKALSCHSIRRGAATQLAMQGHSLNFIRKFLGHANLQTTRLYINPHLKMKDFQKRIKGLMNLCA
jgi:integrase